ncbi:MAG: hypothetical protein B7X58_10945 [Marinobacter sp. 34-60-7]|nr:MAG: hypothetical protein B7X58_10945 [Marinobacter sp. 34-60-7]
MVHQVHRALEGAEDLLADLLDISKLDQQAMQPDRVYTDLAELLEGLADEFRAVAESKGLAFRLRARPAVASTDQRMLTRIVRNLLSNAFRYTRSGGVLLSLRPRREGVALDVWDTGIGIESDKLADIFTEFHQVLPQGAGGRQGVGLGLAIVERMVNVLGYRISVTSAPGSGSRFRLLIPHAEVHPSAGPGAYSPPAPVPDHLRGTRILVLDNEPAVVESMAVLLRRWGCDVLPATSETEALSWINDGHVPQAILADFHLDHDVEGCSAIYHLRQAAGQNIPAAIISADRSDDTRAKVRTQQLPMLNKPVKPNRLRALLASLIVNH